MSRQPGPYDPKESRLSRRSRTRLVIAGVALIVLVLFITQNRNRVDVTFLFFDGRWPLWLLLLLTGLAGALIGQMVDYARERSKRRHDGDGGGPG